MDLLVKVLEEVIERVKPKDHERELVNRVISKVVRRLKEVSVSLNIDADIRVEGSIAKDTWISGDRDIDIFIRLPKQIGKAGLERIGLEIARRAAGNRWVECYAEHPYIEAEIEGFKIDLVPCFNVSRAEEALSSVDRTPFHTEYVKSHLKRELRDEVRLLKQFMKGIGVYGAEIKVQGFSGYLCELLVIHYGSFIDVLREASQWKPYSTIIDIEGYYESPEDALRIFNAPLVVVDPVDPSRNVAAALSLSKMCEFIAAARIFLRKPSTAFFYPPETRPLSFESLVNEIERRNLDYLFIATCCPKVHPDILWGQIYKSRDGIRRLLESHGFKVLRAAAWSDEREYIIFIYELESCILPRAEKHVGPPVHAMEHSDSFIMKHLSSENRIAGPFIENGRWIVYINRRHNNAKNLIERKILCARLGTLIRRCLSRRMVVLVNEEIRELYEGIRDFSMFLTDFLKAKPKWLN